MKYSVSAGKIGQELEITLESIQADYPWAAAEKAMSYLHSGFPDHREFRLIVTDESNEEFRFIGRAETHFQISQWEPILRKALGIEP